MLTTTQRLKIELMTHGVVPTSSAREALSGPEGARPLTAADYVSTSGVSLCFGDGIWANVPIPDHNPNFVREATYTLDHDGNGFIVESQEMQIEVELARVPDYQLQRHSDGRLYSDFAITHTDRVRISPIQGCTYTCKFCDLPYRRTYEKGPLDFLIDSIGLALADQTQPARHVLISGGVPREEDFVWLDDVYRAVPSAFPNVPVDIMMVPAPGLLDQRRLLDYGIHSLAINLELYDNELARRIMPRKARLTSQAVLDFIEEAVVVFGPGRVRSLIIVGIEPVASTLAGVEALAERGCEPVLSPFRPSPDTPMRDVEPPTVELLEDVYLRSRDIVGRHGVRLGPHCIPCMHNTLTFPEDSGPRE